MAVAINTDHEEQWHPQVCQLVRSVCHDNLWERVIHVAHLGILKKRPVKVPSAL
jgi:hypothetical protein